MKYWEVIADNLHKAGWSLGWVSAIDSSGRTIWIADAHRGDGKRFIVRARLPSPAQWVTVNRIRVKDSYTDMEFLSDEFSEKFVPIGFI